jgi:transposase
MPVFSGGSRRAARCFARAGPHESRVSACASRLAAGRTRPRGAADGPSAGWQAQSVRQLHSEYLRHGEAVLKDKPKGGRHHQNLTLQQEQELLTPFLAPAQEGGVLVVAPVQAAYEQAVGRPVRPSVVYRALHRQGWRKIMPRPKHPKASEEVREAFKKSCLK